MPKRTNALDIALLVASIMTTVLLIAYTARVRKLEAAAAPSPTLRVGAQAPPLFGTALSGSPLKVALISQPKPTIIYVFTPICSWCRLNMANLRALIAAKGSEYRFVGVSLLDDRVAGYISQNRLGFSVVLRQVPTSVVKSFRWGATPETIEVSADGRVMLDLRGAYEGANAEVIKREFHLALPGIGGAN